MQGFTKGMENFTIQLLVPEPSLFPARMLLVESRMMPNNINITQ